MQYQPPPIGSGSGGGGGGGGGSSHSAQQHSTLGEDLAGAVIDRQANEILNKIERTGQSMLQRAVCSGV